MTKPGQLKTVTKVLRHLLSLPEVPKDYVYNTVKPVQIVQTVVLTTSTMGYPMR